MYRLLMSLLWVVFTLILSVGLYAQANVEDNNSGLAYDNLPDSGTGYIYYYNYPRSLYLAVDKGAIYHVALNGLDRRNLNFNNTYYKHLYYRIIDKKVPLKFKVIHRFRSQKVSKPIASVDLFYDGFNLNKFLLKRTVIRHLSKDKGVYPTKWKKAKKKFGLYSQQWYDRAKQRDQYKVWIHQPGQSWN